MPTERDVHELKMEWRNNPIYLLEDEPGFEDHRQELIDYRMYWEAIWAERRVKKTDNSITVSVIRFNIIGVVTERVVKRWVSDDQHPDGGYYEPDVKELEKPKVEIDFLARVNTPVETGCMYTDGTNIFVATSNNEIRNVNRHVDTFEIPKSLLCVYKPYSEGHIGFPIPTTYKTLPDAQ